ncbi:MAG: signal peptidase I [Bacteroidales bacterium]|nr:signal peptidase I [Bacteroidales bacterium]
MEDTLLVGDHLFVNRFLFGRSGLTGLLPEREPQRGDVVIFRAPENPATDLVKRCIGVPGDKIEIVGKVLYVNDQEVEDSAYAERRDPRVFPNRRFLSRQTRLRDNFGPIVVPQDEYFFLGDNRDHSYDSRFWGTVPRHFVKGRAFFVYWSYGGETPDGQWHSWQHKIGQVLRTAGGFFINTRWERSFHLVR